MHFHKQAKSFLNHRTFTRKTARLQSLSQESVIDLNAGTHTSPLMATIQNIHMDDRKVQDGRLLNSTAGMLPLLPTSQNDPSGLGGVEAFWNSFSCDRSIAELPSVPAFPARMIHEGSTATADTQLRQASMLKIHILAGGFAPPDLDVLLRVRLGLSGLHAPVSLGVSTVSSRAPMYHARWPHLGGSPFFR